MLLCIHVAAFKKTQIFVLCPDILYDTNDCNIATQRLQNVYRINHDYKHVLFLIQCIDRLQYCSNFKTSCISG